MLYINFSTDDLKMPSPFKKCFFWLEQMQNLKKRKKIKIPAVATSDEWRISLRSQWKKEKNRRREKTKNGIEIREKRERKGENKKIY